MPITSIVRVGQRIYIITARIVDIPKPTGWLAQQPIIFRCLCCCVIEVAHMWQTRRDAILQRVESYPGSYMQKYGASVVGE